MNLRNLVLLFMLVALTGCATRNGPEALKDLHIPSNGEPLASDTWDRIDALPNPKTAFIQDSFFNLLPLIGRLQNFSPNRDGSIYNQTYVRWVDIIPGIFLPLSVKISEFQYPKGHTEESPQGWRLSYNPLWVSAEVRNNTEEPDRLALKAAGVPLLAAWGSMNVIDEKTSSSLSLHANSFLWSLGPMVIKFRGNNQGEEVHGYLATPLLLGGLVGALVWTDFHVITERDYTIGHGPLFGSTLYYSIFKTRYESDEDETKQSNAVIQLGGKAVADRGARLGSDWENNVLGGILWRSFQELDADDRVTRSGYGPLWSFIGWGSVDGSSGPRIFWLTL